jgi:hypothetical protein
MASGLLSFSLFLDYLLAVGSERATIARSHHRPPYDAYGGFKQMLARYASGDVEQRVFSVFVRPDQRRATAFAVRLGHLLGWLGAQRLETPEARAAAILAVPEGELAIARDLAVHVNPELAFMLRGVPHVLKLYLREAPLTQARVRMTVGVMAAALADVAPAGTVFGVLDLTTGKHHVVRDPRMLDRAAAVARADGLSYARLFRETAPAAPLAA